MSLSPTALRVTSIVSWLIAFHVLLAYGLPEGLFVTFLVLLGVLYWRIGALAALTTSLTLVMITVVYGLALRITGFDERIYYRPDEKYIQFDYRNNHRRYEPNVHIEAEMPHGDLRAMTTEDIAEPRRIRFDTDADGFRNSRSYNGQRLLLVGDSFIAGSSNTQEDMLVEQLRRNHNLDTYNLAYPGNLADYAAYIRGFRARHGGEFRVLLFLFEGNDFEESRGRPEGAPAHYGRRYYEMFSGLNTYRVTKSLLKRLRHAQTIQQGSMLKLVEIGGQKVALYQRYVDVSRRSQLPEPEGFETTLTGLRPVIEHVYFIPTNYRVYHKHLGESGPLPNVQWDFLDRQCRKLELRCTNLTPALVRAADAGLNSGELLWWRDDTHWNARGIAATAAVVAADHGPKKN